MTLPALNILAKNKLKQDYIFRPIRSQLQQLKFSSLGDFFVGINKSQRRQFTSVSFIAT